MKPGDYIDKARWLNEVIIPASNISDKVSRTVADLPIDVTPGARQVAMVTTFRAAQADLLEPIMQALEELEALPNWEGGFLVADNIRFNWKTAPFKHYKSFSDFYQQELAEIWGKWSELQETYHRYKRGELDKTGVQDRIDKSALKQQQQAKQAKAEVVQADLNMKAGKKIDPHDNIMKVGPQGTSQSYLLRAIARRAPDVLTAYEQGKFKSVRAAAIAAGIIKVPTPLDQLRKDWKKASAAEQETFRAEIL